MVANYFGWRITTTSILCGWMLVINSSNSVLADGRMSWSGESGQARASFSSSSLLHTVCDSRCPRKLLQLLLTHPHCTYFGRSLLVVTFPGFDQSTATKHISSIKRYKNITKYIHNCSRSSVLWPNNNNKKTRVHPSRHPSIHPSFQSSFKAPPVDSSVPFTTFCKATHSSNNDHRERSNVLGKVSFYFSTKFYCIFTIN